MDLDLEGGRVHVECAGDSAAALVIGVPGLTSDGRQLAAFAEAISAAELRFASVDLRGRGQSSWSGRGSYGWGSHARDLVAIATELGAARFAVVGVSMGGSVAMKVAELAPERLMAVVLVDVAGRVDPGVGPVVAEVLARIEGVDPMAIAEDRASVQIRDPYARWGHLTMPTLLLRATRELRPGAGFVVPVDDVDRFRSVVHNGEVVGVDADHVTIVDDPLATHAAAVFLRSVMT